MKKDESALFMKKDNTEKYKSIIGLLPDDVKQLLSLDSEIDESFNNQMKKETKTMRWYATKLINLMKNQF